MSKYETPYIDIWFELTTKQRRKLSSLGYGPTCFMIGISLKTIRKVTKSKKIERMVIEMNRGTMRLVA